MKKLVSALLLVVLVAAMATPVFATQTLTNPEEAEMTVTATAYLADPTYKIRLPLTLDFNKHTAYGQGRNGVYQGEDGSYPMLVSVSLSDAKYFNGKKLMVQYSGQGSNGELIMKNDKGDELPFHVQTWSANPEWDDDNIFSILEQNANTERPNVGAGIGRTMRVYRSDVNAAGEFSGIMYFHFSFIEG